MVKLDRKAWKVQYFGKINKYMNEFGKCVLVGVDNVQSKQMQTVRAVLRGRAELLMGKNTLIRKALRDMIEPELQPADGKWYEGEAQPQLEQLLPLIKGNIGFCFTDMDLGDVRDILKENKVQAPAKAGIIAPLDVFIEEGPTGLDAQKTSFFQALNLPTKIARGVIAMVSQVKLIVAGEKVGLSEAKLLNMLGVSPFFYGITLEMIYENGQVYPPSVLDISQDDLLNKFMSGASNVAAISLVTGYPTLCSTPHSIMNGFKNCLAIAAATEITFKQAEKIKAYLADPEAFAAANPAAAAAPTDSSAAAAPAAAAAAEESDEDDDMEEMELFD